VKEEDIRSRTVWEGRSWRFRVLEYPLPDGSVKERGVIDHPGSVVIVPIMDDNVLILKQFRIALESTILELPAGTKEPEEEWLNCAQRELREETGYRAASWTSLGKVWPGPGITNELMAVYLARDLSPAPLPPDDDEEIEVVFHRFNELVTEALNGELQDAKSVVAILRAAAFLGEYPELLDSDYQV
jgi:ADP-ribose pyrophosphatase